MTSYIQRGFLTPTPDKVVFTFQPIHLREKCPLYLVGNNLAGAQGPNGPNAPNAPNGPGRRDRPDGPNGLNGPDRPDGMNGPNELN